MRGITIYIATPDNLEILEPGFRKFIGQLCLQQSTGDSTGPRVDVSLGAVRDGFVHQDIGDLQAPAGL